MLNNAEATNDNCQNEKDLEKIASAGSAEKLHVKKDMEPLAEGSFDALDKLRAAYNKYYENKNDTNISLRKKYFNCSFALIFILVFGFIGTTIMVCLCVKNNLAVIVSLVSSIGGLVPSVLILPRIIGRYIFPENEYDGAKDAIEYAKRNNKDKN